MSTKPHYQEHSLSVSNKQKPHYQEVFLDFALINKQRKFKNTK